ncbi:hypothetical protein IAQ67_28625 (plasmid) [Paenibacillus peoriae]|uniref:Uncharacterized protein n=1 Tax=Paenibacillus peoriae TaxID=59893 RepID=A0A7H0YHB9_9BACL|nr:hypothetical protein [Paenibacillus peoriae]QNR70477.1 hypothetical protein IAQ67_28625 [Paenibacillus peoriae]
MNLTPKEEAAKLFIEEKFTPALHQIIESRNPKEYKKWGGNACRQAAIFGYVFLSELLPNYKWTAWDGIFKDIVGGKEVEYNHAWLYGVDRENGRRLLVDASRNHHERLFMTVSGNRYPKDHPSYIHMKELKREKLDVADALRTDEYYTRLPSMKFIELLRDMTN